MRFYDKAKAAYEKALEIRWSVLLAMEIGDFFDYQERFEEAAALCQQLIADTPDRVDLWLLQANAYIGQKEPLKAAEIYELIHHLGKSTPATLNMLGDIYINEELYEMAASSYINAMDKSEDNKPQRAIRSAKILIARGAFDQTRRLIETIESKYADVLSNEQRKDILKLQARLAVADGSGQEEEVRVLEEIVALDPLDGEALILLGQHSGRNEDFEKAVFYFERAAGIEKYEADAKVRHAQLLVQQGKYNDALRLLKSAQKIKPRDNIQEYLQQVERVAKAR